MTRRQPKTRTLPLQRTPPSTPTLLEPLSFSRYSPSATPHPRNTHVQTGAGVVTALLLFFLPSEQPPSWAAIHGAGCPAHEQPTAARSCHRPGDGPLPDPDADTDADTRPGPDSWSGPGPGPGAGPGTRPRPRPGAGAASTRDLGEH